MDEDIVLNMRDESLVPMQPIDPEPPDRPSTSNESKSEAKETSKRGTKAAPFKPNRNPEDPFVGPLSELPTREIPTLIETFRACLLEREVITYEETRSYGDVSDKECINITIDKLMSNLYHFGLQPRRRDKLISLIEKCFKIRAVYLNYKNMGSLEHFPPKSIIKSYKWYEENLYEMLNCVDEKNIPQKERPFYQDQKKGFNPKKDKACNRNMVCSNLDIRETKILQNRLARNEKIKNQTCSSVNLVNNNKKRQNDQDSSLILPTKQRSGTKNPFHDMEIEEKIRPSDPDYQPPHSQWRVKKSFKKKKIDLEPISEEADRSFHNHTETSRATLAVTRNLAENDDYEKVSKNALRLRIKRKRMSTRKKKLKNIKTNNVIAIGFDGREDDTLISTEVKVIKGKKIRQETTKVHHITVVSYPGGERLGHFTCGKKGKDISDGLIAFCKEKNINLDEVRIILCDGCSTNTGRHRRVVTCIETHLKRPLLLDSCLLHAVEKPLQHLIKHLDGPTDGPKSWSGPIGKRIIGDVHKLPITNFKTIENSDFPKCPNKVVEKLNTDQKYIFKICQAILTGILPQGLSDQRPGNMCHSRWLTTAARILRLYMSEENPSEQFERLVNYILFVYMPTWLNVHWHSNIKNASKHLLEEIQRVNEHCNESEKSIVLPIIQINGFSGYSEMVLLCMLMHDDQILRQESVNKILEIRNKTKNIVRKRKANEINFQATSINELCSLNDATEPPIIMQISDDVLKSFVNNPFELDIPCHTQSVERNVRLTTECAAAVPGTSNQEGYAFNVIAARKAIP